MYLKLLLVVLTLSLLAFSSCSSNSLAEKISEADRCAAEKNWDGAIQSCKNAIMIDPAAAQARQKLAVAYNNRGKDYNQNKQWDTAIADFNSALENEPNLAAAFNNRGFAYEAKGQATLANAYSLLDHGDDVNGRIEIDNSIKLFTQSIENLNKAVALQSGLSEAKTNLANTLNDRGHAYNLIKQYDAAIPDLTKSIELNSNLAQAYNDRGWAYNGKKDWDTAIPDLTRAIDLDPKMALAYNNRGWAYHEKQKYNEALVDLNKAISLNPNLAVAYLNRGITYLYLSNREAARADFNYVLSITRNPELVSAADQGLSLIE
jgi:tetratricopeptide (TPR) repeat protein